TQQRIRALAEEIARLSVVGLSPAEYYPEFLQRLLRALAAPAGYVWLRTPQGHFQQQCHLNPGEIDTELTGARRNNHDELLRQVATQGRPLCLPAQDHNEPNGAAGRGFPAVLVAPVFLDEQVVALLEIWHGSQRDAQAIPGITQAIVRIADLVAVYL